MFWLKSCVRCGGDLYDSEDIYGRFTACAQCGYYLTDDEQAVLTETKRPVGPASVTA